MEEKPFIIIAKLILDNYSSPGYTWILIYEQPLIKQFFEANSNLRCCLTLPSR